MSRISLSGNPSGTGTLTIAAPNSNSDLTFNLPATLGNSGASALVSTDASGNLGLGVTPSAWTSTYKAIDVTSRTSFVGTTGGLSIFANNAYFNGTNWIYRVTDAASRYQQDTSAHKWFTAPSGTAGNAISFTQAMTLDASGNLGVGVTSVSSNISGSARVLGICDPVNTNLSSVRLGSGSTFASGARMEVYASSSQCGLYGQDSIPMVFTTNSIERARIDSSGNLLVAMSSTVGVARTQIAYAPNVNVGLSLYPTNTTYNNAAVTFLNNGGTTVGFIYQNGSSTQFSTTSDYRLKENVQPMTGALAKVQALKPVTYTWKSTGETDEGFIAHELQAVCPSAVNGEKDAINEDGSIKPQGIDTSFLVATLTAAIQELKAIVDAQGAEIAALKGTA